MRAGQTKKEKFVVALYFLYDPSTPMDAQILFGKLHSIGRKFPLLPLCMHVRRYSTQIHFYCLS